jgi:hypothetical protein
MLTGVAALIDVPEQRGLSAPSFAIDPVKTAPFPKPLDEVAPRSALGRRFIKDPAKSFLVSLRNIHTTMIHRRELKAF